MFSKFGCWHYQQFKIDQVLFLNMSIPFQKEHTKIAVSPVFYSFTEDSKQVNRIAWAAALWLNPSKTLHQSEKFLYAAQ
jgi:hypothetical protein